MKADPQLRERLERAAARVQIDVDRGLDEVFQKMAKSGSFEINHSYEGDSVHHLRGCSTGAA